MTVRPVARRSGPKAWSRVLGTVYAFTENPAGRVPTLYVGMTAQVPWTKRISQHLYGRGGSYRSRPKDWADLVPGYRDGLDAVVRQGGAYIVWQKQCWYWWLKARESWHISRLSPVYNYLENQDNPLRVTKWDAHSQRAIRDRQQEFRVWRSTGRLPARFEGGHGDGRVQ